MFKKIVFYDDLSDEAKDKAMEWFRSIEDFPFLEDAMTEFVKTELEEAGYIVEDLRIFYSLGHCQGDGASFTATLIKDGETYKVNRNDSNYNHEMTISEVYHETDEGEETDEAEKLEEMRTIARRAKKYGYDIIEYTLSDDSVEDSIRINEYTFAIDGERMNPDNF